LPFYAPVAFNPNGVSPTCIALILADPDTNILVNLDPVIYDGPNGLVDILLTSIQTAQLPITEALYDIERFPLTGAEDIEKILKGKFLIHPEVTSGVDADYS